MTKILLVEDDPMISEIYQRKFISAGFDSKIAATGKAVLEMLQNEPFDLVLLDIVLPEMNGMDVLEQIRSPRNSYDPNLKVIIFSNLSEKDDREKATKLGADGFISKTEFSPSQLIEEVSRFLRQFNEKERRNNKGTEDVSKEADQKSILFIEDEEVFSDMFGKRLEEEGYHVEYATDGSDGLKKAESSPKPFDLVITDLVIPGMLGTEVLVRLKKDDRYQNTPLFLFSASLGDEESLDEADRVFDKYFVKTRVTPTDIAHEVNEILKKKEE